MTIRAPEGYLFVNEYKQVDANGQCEGICTASSIPSIQPGEKIRYYFGERAKVFVVDGVNYHSLPITSVLAIWGF